MTIENATTLETTAESATNNNYNTETADHIYSVCEDLANEGKLSHRFVYTDLELSYSHLDSIKTELETYGYICSITTNSVPEDSTDYPATETYRLAVSWDVT